MCVRMQRVGRADRGKVSWGNIVLLQRCMQAQQGDPAC